MDERNVEEELKTGAAVNDGEHQEESHSPAPNENEHYQGSSAVTTALTTDTAGTSEGPLITLDEFIEDQIKLEAEAEALLGGSDDMVCTYPEGYKPRQPLYACLDCVTGQSDFAGVCYGCSLHCHGNHNLIELYTKRNFCCDCGNSKFPSPCTLFKVFPAFTSLRSLTDLWSLCRTTKAN
ncbi:hypothetical protein AB6A40_010819 [Gnathostoma spinigerum]|uniref:UBR-type domain-containing protein n=1 Tax=Gnathostoma spinigerum TaxID=75299 RepID=A0ABD6EVZ2_9BILA